VSLARLSAVAAYVLGATAEKLSKSGQRINHCDVGRVLINRDRLDSLIDVRQTIARKAATA
jgi:hypothetical protein